MKLLIVCFIFSCQFVFSQKYLPLSDELKEISGLQFLNDSLLVAHNDGGNSPTLFLINSRGKILKKVLVMNAKNHDWEDVTCNSTHVFIGDFGNNNNKRQNLQILRIEIESLLKKDSVFAEKMFIEYEDQKAFPPENSEKNFDAECLIYAEGHLWIFTKNYTTPFNGLTKIYKFTFEVDKKLVLPVFATLKIGKNGWMKDAITGGEYAFGHFYLLTYDRILKVEKVGNKFTILREKRLPQYKQHEALSVFQTNRMLIGNEQHKYLGKQKLLQYSFE